MFTFLHNFQPKPILFSFGSISIYWYGLFVVLGILSAVFISYKLADVYKIDKEKIIDLAFWIIVFGIIGARIYHIFLEFNYYLKHPLDVFKIWNGGIAIHGGIIAGLIVIYLFSKKEKINFWLLTSIIVPGLALGQAIGRWGNYFNQELFGLPTNLPWGIPINIINRPIQYISFSYFHPTFLYESLGNLLIFFILFFSHLFIIRKQKKSFYSFFVISAVYAILYSILRFGLEFIRIDSTPVVYGWRWPQIVSVIIIIVFVSLFFLLPKIKKNDRVE